MTRPRLADLLACLALLALTLGCFARLVARPDALLVDGNRPSIDHAQREDIRVLGNDLTYVFLPHYTHVARQIERFGRLPRWDTSGFAGRPMIGNPQGGLFYPPVWLVLRSRSPAALGWLTVGHLLWGGFGVYVLLRGAGSGRLASTVAAGCFQASPYVLAQTFEGHYPHVWAACWYPWAFHAFASARRGRPGGMLCLPPILALTFLTGHPQEWYYLAFALSLWTVADAIREARRGRPRAALATLAIWAGVVAASFGLVAVELLPDLAAQGWTLHGSRLALGHVSRYQLHAINLFQLLGPTALGGPEGYFGRDNYWETVLSIGLVPLVLAAIAVVRHPDRKRVRGWLLLVVAAVIFAAGRRLGVFPLLFELVPGMNRFRVPARSLFLATLGAAALTGLGVEALTRLAGSPDDWRSLERQFRQCAAIVVAGLVACSVLARFQEALPGAQQGRSESKATNARGHSLPPWAPRESQLDRITGGRGPAGLAAAGLLGSGVFWFGLVGTAGTLGLGGCLRASDRRALTVVLGTLALVELGMHGHALLKVAPAARFLGDDPISRELARARSPFSGPYRIRARDILYQDLQAGWNGIEKININDSFQIQHAADLYETLYPLLYVLPPPDPDDPMGEAVATYRREVRQGVLDRLGVAFLVSDHAEPEPTWPIVAEGTADGARFVIHRNPSALPRAYVVPRAIASPDDPAAVLSRFRHLDPREGVLMRRDPLGPDASRQPFTPGEWASTDPDRVVVRVTTRAPGLLVVADTWMPGWTARVDGRAAPIYRGNHAQRVIPLPEPGRHEVVMRYEAPGLARGLVVTGISSVAWTAACLASIVARNRRARVGLRRYPRPHFALAGVVRRVLN